MPRVRPFEQHVQQYERWFERHVHAYHSELEAIKALLPARGHGIEIGVGTGRFAAPLGIRSGVEPAKAMRELARQRGLDVIDAVAEALPYADASIDYALMVTTICFVDDITASFNEARRVLKPGGALVIGFVDRNSPLGRDYEAHKASNVFYKDASFYSVDEVIGYLRASGFSGLEFTQTVFHPLVQITQIEPVKTGYGTGSFVVVKALKSPEDAKAEPHNG